MVLRALFAIALCAMEPAQVCAQSSDAFLARRAVILPDPVRRAAEIERLEESIEAATARRARIDSAPALALTISGAVATALGLAAAIGVPLIHESTAALGTGLSCAYTLGYSCERSSTPGWVGVVAGTGAAVGVAGLIMLLYGAVDLRRTRDAARPIDERIARDRRELDILLAVDLTAAETSLGLGLRGSF